VSVYEQRVGRVCDEINDNDRARARADKTVRKRLQTAKTTIAQRNALLDGVRQSIARSGHGLAAFAALETPKSLATTHERTQAAWNRNLARLREYALRLDRSATNRQLLATLDHLGTLRPLLASDGVVLSSGLEHLGQANCDLRPPIVTATFTLPPLATNRHARSGTHAKRPHKDAPANTGSSTGRNPSSPNSAGSTSTSTSTSTNGSGSGSGNGNSPNSTGSGRSSTGANTPGATGGGSGGGGGGG
jgi:hypothetical protein